VILLNVTCFYYLTVKCIHLSGGSAIFTVAAC